MQALITFNVALLNCDNAFDVVEQYKSNVASSVTLIFYRE